MSLLPELTGPADLYYDEKESKSYNRNSRITKVQAEITSRAIQLLEIENGFPLVLDLGCGGGLSGHVLSENGYEWVGVDIAPSMLGVARENCKSLGLVLSDLGSRLPFKEDSFDYAISISAVQWLFQSYRKEHLPTARIRTFFRSLYEVVKTRAVIQFYCGKRETEILKNEARRAGFYGGLVVDDEGTKNCKHFLVLSRFRPVRDIQKFTRKGKRAKFGR